eukprot:g32112.t1
MTTDLKRTKRSIQRLPQYLAQISSITEVGKPISQSQTSDRPPDVPTPTTGAANITGTKTRNPPTPKHQPEERREGPQSAASHMGRLVRIRPYSAACGQKQRGPIRRRSTILRRRPPWFCKEERYGDQPRSNPPPGDQATEAYLRTCRTPPLRTNPTDTHPSPPRGKDHRSNHTPHSCGSRSVAHLLGRSKSSSKAEHNSEVESTVALIT